MKNLRRIAVFVVAAFWVIAAFAENTAVIPVPRAFPTNWMSSHEAFVARAKQGHIDLLFLGDSSLGYIYKQRGAPQDYVEAVKWFRKAAEQGHPMAQGYLGEYYQRGHGVLTSVCKKTPTMMNQRELSKTDSLGQFPSIL